MMNQGLSMYNVNDNMIYTVENETPDGAVILKNPNGEQFYTTEEEVINNPNWVQKVPTEENQMVMAALDDATDFSIQALREDFTEYFMQWAGKKSPEEIYNAFVSMNNLKDPIALGELNNVYMGMGVTASVEYPVLAHLTVDSVSESVEGLLDSPDACMAVAFSRYPGYDLMVIGYPKLIREVLSDRGVYIDMMKTAPIPKDYGSNSFVDKISKKSNIRLGGIDKAVFSAYIDYYGLSSESARALFGEWLKTNDRLSMSDFLRFDSSVKMSIMNKEIPMTVDEYDMEADRVKNKYPDKDKPAESIPGEFIRVSQ